MTVIHDVTDRLVQQMREDKVKNTKEKMAARLQAMGLKPITEKPKDQPRCALECSCGGGGYVRKNPKAAPSDRDFGKMEICPNYAARQIKDLARTGHLDVRVGIRGAELELAWDLVKPDLSDGMKAVSAVRPALERGHGLIVLRGTFGQAKTLVGKIMTATALLSGKSAAYANMSRILDDIRLAYDSQEAKTTELLRRMDWWVARDVLFIDEIDRVNGTDWAEERMFQLVDQRWTRAVREEALTVVATNAPVKELDGYLQSRIKDNRLGPIVELNGTDGRQVMPKGYKH